LKSRVRKRQRTWREKVLRLIQIRLAPPSMQKFLGLCQNNSLHASSQRFLAVRNVNSVFSRVETVVYVIPNNSRVGRGGQWFHDGKRTSINVDPDGRNLTVINENGQRSSGYANSPNELEIPSLRIKGRVGDGGRRISWNNGTTWTRQPHEHGSASGQGPSQDLGGRWFHDGKPTSVSMSPGGSVTITNEQGQTSSGHMMGNNIVIFCRANRQCQP